MSRLVTAVALVVLLLVPAAWWHGRLRTEGAALITPSGKLHALGMHRGRVLVLMTDVAIRPPGEGGAVLLSSSALAVDHMVETLHRNDQSLFDALGVRVTSGDAAIRGLAPGGGRTLVVLPPWVPCLVAAAIIVAPAMKRRRHATGHCRTCGYDLRGSGERCPECGTAMDVHHASRDCAGV
jgi:hypothetical protein